MVDDRPKKKSSLDASEFLSQGFQFTASFLTGRGKNNLHLRHGWNKGDEDDFQL